MGTVLFVCMLVGWLVGLFVDIFVWFVCLHVGCFVPLYNSCNGRIQRWVRLAHVGSPVPICGVTKASESLRVQNG